MKKAFRLQRNGIDVAEITPIAPHTEEEIRGLLKDSLILNKEGDQLFDIMSGQPGNFLQGKPYARFRKLIP